MSVAPAVSDASPLIVFHQIQRLELLHEVLGEVLIPPAVANEIAPTFGTPPSWVRVSEAASLQGLFPWGSGLDPGGAEAIALALDVSARQIVLDERSARRIAEQLGLFVVGSLGVLLEARRLGLVGDVQPDLDAMIDVGFHIGQSLYTDVLMLAREFDEEAG
jgi:predicted nucleic acid-binding protein